MKNEISKNEILEIMDRVSEDIVSRTKIEPFLPGEIVEELKQNPSLFYTSIIKEDRGFEYLFTFYNGEKFISLQYPVQHKNHHLDTKALLAFSCICANKYKHGEKYKEIYDRLLETVLSDFLDNGIKILI